MAPPSNKSPLLKWQHRFGRVTYKDDVTINIHADITDQLDEHVLGGALPAFMAGVDYTDIETALTADATTADDATAVANLPADSKGQD